VIDIAKDNIGVLKTDIGWIKETLTEVRTKLESLPCVSHTEKIQSLCNTLDNKKKDSDNKMYWAIGITAILVSIIELGLRYFIK